MALYTATDLKLLTDNWPKIQEEVKAKREKLLISPTLNEKKTIQQMVITYAREHKNKLYGGYCLNMLISEKNKKDAFYTDEDVPDVDMYSTHPKIDLGNICQILYDKGYKNIVGREAQHSETYSIFVNNLLYCDISYIPMNIYSKMPFKIVNGLMLTQPIFMRIDHLRIATDPLISYWRNDDMKAIKRFVLLEKYFPMPHNENAIDIEGSTLLLDSALNRTYNFISKRDSLVHIGFYAYDHFLKESKIMDNKKPTSKKFKFIAPPYYEMISTNYRIDFFELITDLKKDPLISSKLKHIEFYPFSQYTDSSVEIYVEGNLVAKIYNNNNRCYPYLDVLPILFKDKSYEPSSHNKRIKIGTFQVTMMHILINIMRFRTNEDKDNINLCYTMISHLVEMRNYYLNNNKKTILDNTLFRDYVVQCTGDTMTPEQIRQKIIDIRKKKKKGAFTFRYDARADPPDFSHEREFENNFANSSGKEINNPKNLRLGIEINEIDTDEEEQ